jgi:hypothetical protein
MQPIGACVDRSAHGGRPARPSRAWLYLAACGLVLAGFAAGRLSAGTGPGPVLAQAAPWSAATVSIGAVLPVQASPAPGDPRELVPLLPGPGDGPFPGLTPEEAAECLLFMGPDGELYRLDVPAPGEGPGPGGPQELIPLQPLRPQPSPLTPQPPQPPQPPGTLRAGGAPAGPLDAAAF